MGNYRHWGAAQQVGITGNGDVDDLDEPEDMEYSLVAPWHGGQWGWRKQFEYLRSLRNPNIIQRGLNADFLDGKHGASYVLGPDSSTICNIPCFSNTTGDIQDTGLSSADLLTDGRASATPALTDKFGFWDADDSDDPKTATLSALKTALGVGGGDVSASANITDNRLVRGDGGAKGIQESGITVDDSDNMTGVESIDPNTIELGGAAGNTDTTLTRAGAGLAAVEGDSVVVAPDAIDDNAIVRGHGGVNKVQNSSASVDDSGNIAAPNLRNTLHYPPGQQISGNGAVTAFSDGVTNFVYLGRARAAITTLDVLASVTTAVAGTITYAEVAVFTGAPVLNGNASLTRVGYTDVSATFNSTGLKKTTVSLSGVTAGDHLWAAFASAVTGQGQANFQLRGGNSDFIQSGQYQTATGRPSTLSSPTSTTIYSTTAVPPWIGVGW